jgi:Histidine kinase
VTTAVLPREGLLRERWAIIAGFAGLLLLVRVGPLFVFGWLRDGLDTIGVRDATWGTILALLPLPLIVGVLQRRMGSLVQLAAALAYFLMLIAVNFADLVRAMPADDLMRIVLFMPFTLPTPLILYFAIVGVVRALQWSRASLAVELERRRLASMETRRTRREVERRSKPATISAALARIEALLPDRADAAEVLVHRLARYARGLLRVPVTQTVAASVRTMRRGLDLRGIATAIEVTGEAEETELGADVAAAIESAIVTAAPPCVEIRVRESALAIASTDALLDELARVLAAQEIAVRRGEGALEVPANPVVAAETARPVAIEAPRSLFRLLLSMVVVCGVFATVNDLRTAEWQPELGFGRTVGLALFAIAGPLVWLLAARAARVPMPASIATVAVIAFGIGSAVTALAILITDAVMGGPERLAATETFPWYVLITFTRNATIAVAVASIAFADATSRVLLARKLETERYRDEVALEEARELEARFHPHFLFNALTSIAALIRSDPRRAATMCGRLSELFRRIVASAGVQRWPLATELELAFDYLLVQRMRFGERLRIAWDVPATAGIEVPRLMLQPLLENAVKHAVSRRAAGTNVGLAVRKRRRAVSFEVWNDVAPSTGAVSHGRGLAFVRSSVEAAGGQVGVERANGRFRVTCTIPR